MSKEEGSIKILENLGLIKVACMVDIKLFFLWTDFVIM